MAVTETDGGAPPSRPTPSPSSSSSDAARAAAKAPIARPSSSTTTSRSRSTLYNRLPAEDRPTTPSLDEAVRTTRRSGSAPSKPAPSSPSDGDRDRGRSEEAPGRRSRGSRGSRREEAPGRRTPGGEQGPTVEQRAADEAQERRGRRTENDGRADGELRRDSHEGGRDERIAQLRARQDELRSEENRVEDEIEDVAAEIESDEGKASTVGTVVNVATAPVTAVMGLFGRSNPIGDAAESAAERVLGLEEQREELETRESELEAMREEIEAEIERLEQERTLNFLADVAHVTDMPEPIADALEGAGSIAFEIVEATGLGSDAAYASEERAIVIDDAVIEKVNENYEELRRAGIVDEDGRIIDADAFDEHEAGDAAISTTALLGVHEVTHGAQDQSDLIAQAQSEGEAIIAEARAIAEPVGGFAGEAMIDEAYRTAELNRIDMLEYDAYVNQETLELQAGKQKQGFITVNPDGSLLPREQAVENIYQFQLGQPLLHGTSAGESFAGVVASQEGGGGDGETPGRYTPGRYTPGSGAPGRYTPGEDAPGRYTPGSDAPGRYTPGRYTPGEDAPGRYTPGRYTPGSDAPGRYTPGFVVPGLFAPGSDAPGRYTPGRYTPGSDAPGRYTPGRYTPGSDAPGRYTPGSETA